MKVQQHIVNRLKLSKIIYFVFLIQPLVLGFVLSQNASLKGMDIPLLMLPPNLIFVLAAMGTFAAGIVVPKLFLSSGNIKKIIAKPWTKEYLSSLTSDGRSIYSDETIAELLQASPQDQNLFKLTNHAFVPFIIGCVLFESCTLFGFLIAHNTQNLSLYLPFVIPTYVGMALQFPSIDKFIQLVETHR